MESAAVRNWPRRLRPAAPLCRENIPAERSVQRSDIDLDKSSRSPPIEAREEMRATNRRATTKPAGLRHPKEFVLRRELHSSGRKFHCVGAIEMVPCSRTQFAPHAPQGSGSRALKSEIALESAELCRPGPESN